MQLTKRSVTVTSLGVCNVCFLYYSCIYVLCRSAQALQSPISSTVQNSLLHISTEKSFIEDESRSSASNI